MAQCLSNASKNESFRDVVSCMHQILWHWGIISCLPLIISIKYNVIMLNFQQNITIGLDEESFKSSSSFWNKCSILFALLQKSTLSWQDNQNYGSMSYKRNITQKCIKVLLFTVLLMWHGSISNIGQLSALWQ